MDFTGNQGHTGNMKTFIQVQVRHPLTFAGEVARIHTGKLRVKGDVVAFRMLGRLISLGILAHLVR